VIARLAIVAPMRKAVLVVLVAGAAAAAVPDGVRDFVALDARTIALTHVRVIDGTGAPARADQTVVIEDGRIRAVGDAATTAVPAGAQVIDLTGKSVFPGLVGMHDHLFMTAIREQPIFLNLLKDGVGYDPAKLLDSVRGRVAIE